MIGFVSALSSSLAVIILIMSVMLINMMKSAYNSQGEHEGGEQQNTSQNTTAPPGNYEARLTMSSNVIDKQLLNEIIADAKNNSITIYCTYGKNLSKEVAIKYTTFNVIYLSKELPGKTISVGMPLEDNSSWNRCYIKHDE